MYNITYVVCYNYRNNIWISCVKKNKPAERTSAGLNQPKPIFQSQLGLALILQLDLNYNSCAIIFKLLIKNLLCMTLKLTPKLTTRYHKIFMKR
jgi:hypothetical protein